MEMKRRNFLQLLMNANEVVGVSEKKDHRNQGDNVILQTENITLDYKE